MPSDQHAAVLIGESIHVHFGGVLQEPVNQHGPLLREDHGFVHVAFDHLLVVGDHHGAPAQHITWTHQHRIAQPSSHRAGFFGASCGAVLGRGNAEIVQQLSEQLAIFRAVYIGRVGADNRNTRVFEGKLQR